VLARRSPEPAGLLARVREAGAPYSARAPTALDASDGILHGPLVLYGGLYGALGVDLEGPPSGEAIESERG